MVVIYFILGYLLGSIPFGYILVKLIKKDDIRNYGSGNIGATNVKRVLGIKWAVVTFFLDALKGFIPSFLAYRFIDSPWSYIVMISPFLGHCYTIWLRGKGGKGVATSAGILLSIIPIVFSALFILWLVIVKTTKKSSLGAITVAIILPFSVYFTNKGIPVTIFTIVLAVWVILRHRENIKRLISGNENEV